MHGQSHIRCQNYILPHLLYTEIMIMLLFRVNIIYLKNLTWVCEGNCHTGCVTVRAGTNVQTFQRKLLPSIL